MNGRSGCWLIGRKSVGLLGLVTAIAFSSPIRGEDGVENGPHAPPMGPRSRLVRMDIQASGEVFAESPGGTVRRPFSMRQRMEWVECLEIAGGSDADRSDTAAETRAASAWRTFLLTSRESRFADRPPVVTALGAGRRMVFVRSGTGSLSPGGPLTQEEAEIVDFPFDPLILEQIVAWHETADGRSGTAVPRSFLPPLLGLDTIEAAVGTSPSAPREKPTSGDSTEVPAGDLFIEPTPPIDPSAARKLRMRGAVAGALKGAVSRIGIDGELELASDGTTVTAAVLHVCERRGTGFAAPGLESRAMVAISCRGIDEPGADETVRRVLPDLTAAASRPGPRPDDPRLAWYEPAGRWCLRYDPRWTLVAAEGQSLRMRLIDEGALVAEATITPLAASGEASLATFREDVRTALGERFVGFDASDERSQPDGSRLLRVVVAAESGSRRFRESHFVVLGTMAAARPGAGAQAEPPEAERRIALAVVTDGSLLDRLGEADLRLVEGITLSGGCPGGPGTDASEP